MKVTAEQIEQYCVACVYYPPNLPPAAYPADDYDMLQQKNCSYDFFPGDAACNETRKTSCSVVDMSHLKKQLAGKGEV